MAVLSIATDSSERVFGHFEIAFFDDNPECVAGAVEAGMLGRLCDGVGGLRLALAGLGIPDM